MVGMVPADMRKAAVAWESAGNQVKSANPAGRVGEISTAMPGGASARQVSSLVGTLDDRFDEWWTGAAQMGENYRNVADDHQTTDQNAGEQGRQHAAAVETLPSIWAAAPSVTSGPAIFDPGTPPSERMANLIGRLGEVGS